MNKTRISLLITTLFLLTALAFATLPMSGVFAQTASKSITPSADAYVIDTNPSTNYGTATVLRVDNSPITRSYIRFVISGLNGAAISSAKLRLYANSSNSTGYTVNALTDNTWTEAGITYSNAPVPGSALATSPAVNAGGWVETDISSYIKAEGTYNLVLTIDSPTNTSLGAREAGANAPQLVVTYSAAVPTSTSVTNTSSPTNTAVPTATNTPTKNHSKRRSTATPVVPTATAIIPTATRVIPTATPVSPTATAVVPTATQVVPTQTPTTSPSLTRVSLTKGPDLIYLGSNTTMKIFWQWTANTSFQVDWGTSAAYGSSTGAINTYDTTNHLYSATLSGLTPGTKYFYRVVVGNQYSDGTFYTAPAASAADLKFVSYGDDRTNASTHNTVAGQVVQLFQTDPGYQTVNLSEGDLVSSGDTDSAWTSEMFATNLTNIRSELANLSHLSVIGNHEGSGALFTRYFPMPFVASRYWSFDYGPMHVVMMDQYTSYGSGSAQYNWLKNDLAATTKKWKVVVLHEPGWSANGGHANNTTVQSVYEPLFEQYQVALVLGGHNHYYARAMVNGIAHLTVGTGGAPLYTPASGQPNIVKTYSGNGYARFAITGSTLTGWFVNTSGTVIDTFTVTR